jgi:hypothetical protein
MWRAENNGESTAEKTWTVLMARIVDRHGVIVRPDQVGAIEYSIYEIYPGWPSFRTVVNGHSDVPLDVRATMFDSLQISDGWTADCVGYNFRHEIVRHRAEAFRKRGVEYELQYRFTTDAGMDSVVRFAIGC